MKHSRTRLAAAALLLATAACGGHAGARPQYCPLAPGIAPTDTMVLDAVPASARLGRHLQVWLQAPEPHLDVTKLQLFLDGHPIAGVPATQIGGRCVVRDAKGKAVAYQETYEFVPRRTDGSREAWSHLLGSPGAFVDTMQVGLGLAGGPAFRTVPGKARVAFSVADPTMSGIVLVLFVVLAGLVVWAALTTSLLRDPAPSGDQHPAVDPAKGTAAPRRAPYSLARTMMAMWTLIILGGFLGIWLITGDPHGILTSQALLLFGIVGVTGAASGAITQRANEPVTQEIHDAQARTTEARERAHAMRGEAEVMGNVRMDVVRETEMTALRHEDNARILARRAPQTRQFLLDLISDGNGPSLTRLQNLLWHVTLALVFIEGTYRVLAFPAFDATLMSLLGISESLYLGVKLTAPPKPADEPARDDPSTRSRTEEMIEARKAVQEPPVVDPPRPDPG
ncbi:MAG TPA: hypothetical protein VFJ82_03935 [Longimicrobium sp.]|nr:hypothetical protein [Longimicrobium sp.]